MLKNVFYIRAQLSSWWKNDRKARKARQISRDLFMKKKFEFLAKTSEKRCKTLQNSTKFLKVCKSIVSWKFLIKFYKTEIIYDCGNSMECKGEKGHKKRIFDYKSSGGSGIYLLGSLFVWPEIKFVKLTCNFVIPWNSWITSDQGTKLGPEKKGKKLWIPF